MSKRPTGGSVLVSAVSAAVAAAVAWHAGRRTARRAVPDAGGLGPAADETTCQTEAKPEPWSRGDRLNRATLIATVLGFLATCVGVVLGGGTPVVFAIHVQQPGTTTTWAMPDVPRLSIIPRGQKVDLAFSVDNGILAIADADGTVDFWDIESGRHLAAFAH
jgi:hypothetical protein